MVGTINGISLSGTGTCASVIGDGKWHQVVFTLSPVETNSIATLYLDGVDITYVDNGGVASGEVASRTTPPTPACPSGCITTYAYTSGSETAIGGGTEPTGLHLLYYGQSTGYRG